MYRWKAGAVTFAPYERCKHSVAQSQAIVVKARASQSGSGRDATITHAGTEPPRHAESAATPSQAQTMRAEGPFQSQD